MILKRLAAFSLWSTVHLDALRLEPGPYLTATKWWILRKRVRARGQFAPLLNQSPKAYELWALSEEREPLAVSLTVGDLLVALVVGGDDQAKLVATLSSLAAAGIRAHLVSTAPVNQISEGLSDQPHQKPSWIMPIEAGDLVPPNAGALYNDQIKAASPSCSVIFADDDRLDHRGRRKDPHFKPGWNSELFRHHDYLTGSCIVRADEAMLAEAAKQPNWDSWLVNEAIRRGSVAHIPAVLHHRASRQPTPREVQPLTIADTLPSVSVIIPTRNRADLLRTCIAGLRATDYPNLEIIIADNDSDDPETLAYFAALAQQGITILPQPGPFNYSTINNNAVAIAQGEFICLMNNDIEVLKPDWLAIMVTQALRPEVGAVGAQLLYPDGRIQHAGVVIGVGNAAGHAHKFLRPEDEGYFRRHALPQYVSAVTAACLVVRKDKFLAVGGLDDKNFAVAFNDVDLCLKLNQQGWQSFYEPRAVLVHHESISRGHDKDPVGAARFAKELAALQRIWRTDEIIDPYHHPNLSRASEQFAISLTL